MSTVVIDPSVVAEGEPEKISADMRKFNKAKQQVDLAVSELKKYEIITTPETAAAAMDVLKLAKQVDTAIETKRKNLGKPFKDAKDKIDAHAKDLVKSLVDAIDVTKRAVLLFQEVEQKKAKAKMIADRKTVLESIGFLFDESKKIYQREGIGLMTALEIEAYNDDTFNTQIGIFNSTIIASTQKIVEETQEKSELDNMFSGESSDAPLVEAPPVVQPKIVTSPGTGTFIKGTTKRWTFEVTEPSQIPIEYLQVNEVAVRKAIADGTRSIPGFRIYQDTTLTIR